MLVISRQQSETVRIGNDVTITIVRVGNSKVRLGIDAPNGVNILRDNAQTRTPKIKESKQETV